mgnify:CR=1 FL=1
MTNEGISLKLKVRSGLALGGNLSQCSTYIIDFIGQQFDELFDKTS